MSLSNVGDFEILFHWNHLDWLFEDEALKKRFYENRYWTGAMPAGFKVDQAGNYYLSVPRWSPGIPATVNRIQVVDGKPMLAAYPNWQMNTIGDPNALQSVLGWEIDELNRAWFLDQGHIEGKRCIDGAQKIVCWDLTENRLVESIPIPDAIASYDASFLNDLVVDNKNGFLYIADSGIFSDPLQGGLIVYNMRTKQLRRVLHQHVSTQDVPGYWFKIAGKPVWADRPMRTGADGIALSADRKTLYWCALTARRLYAVDTALLRDMATPHEVIEAAVVDLGDKGTNTDGMGADNRGLIYYTMLEGQGIGRYDPAAKRFSTFVSDERMIWVDGMTFDTRGHLIFNSNRLHELFGNDIDFDNPYNFVVWRAWLGGDVRSYLYAR
ncbi:MAG: SMP-30/gluconolactonase/LRE family protein [Anaerolineae bacterium]|nr:SMP-30/gluconolactonase/LRE family protein [Anaerolineae bacterium]